MVIRYERITVNVWAYISVVIGLGTDLSPSWPQTITHSNVEFSFIENCTPWYNSSQTYTEIQIIPLMKNVWKYPSWAVVIVGLLTLEFNTLRPRQNGRFFSRPHFKMHFLEWKVWISIIISLKFVSKRPINNNTALVQIMAWRRPGDEPLSELMVVSLLTHICVIRPQWVKEGMKDNIRRVVL